MSTPWFLERLGLDESVDERAIKRAYATRLKKINQATDIAGFTELHRVYQAALAWHVSRVTAPEKVPPPFHGDEPTIGSVATSPESSPDHSDSRVANDGIGRPEEMADMAHAQLADRMASGESAEIALTEQLAMLRLGHLRAPFLFELRLIESLANGSILHRFELYNAAQRHFSWRDIGHLSALGRHGEWVIAAKKESQAWSTQWQQLPGVMLLDALKIGSVDGLPSANHWPKIHDIIRRYPNFVPLQLDLSRVNALKLAFDALPDSDKEWALDTSRLSLQRPDPQTRKPASRSRFPIGMAIVIAMLVIRLIGALATGATTQASQDAIPPRPTSLLALNLQRFAPTQQSCQSLLPIVERSAPFQDDERAYLQRAVRSCLEQDYWPGDHQSQEALRKLDI